MSWGVLKEDGASELGLEGLDEENVAKRNKWEHVTKFRLSKTSLDFDIFIHMEWSLVLPAVMQKLSDYRCAINISLYLKSSRSSSYFSLWREGYL